MAYSSRLIAAARAAESERQDALFVDPFAEALAGTLACCLSSEPLLADMSSGVPIEQASTCARRSVYWGQTRFNTGSAGKKAMARRRAMIKQRAANNALLTSGGSLTKSGTEQAVDTDPVQPGTDSVDSGTKRAKKTVNNITARTIFIDHLILLLTQAARNGAPAGDVPDNVQQHVQGFMSRAAAVAPKTGPPEHSRFEQVYFKKFRALCLRSLSAGTAL